MIKQTEIKIDTINLTIGKKEVSLSTSDARKLLTVLKELFGDEKSTYIPYPVYTRPWYYSPRPYWDSGIVYMSNTSDSISMNVNEAYQGLLDYQNK